MPIREEAINVFMGLPGDGDRLELTYNHGVDSYELGTGYNHIALTVDDIDGHARRARGAGHRAREAAVPRARGRVADRLRPRSRRLPHRADREELGSGCPPSRDSRSSTAGRTRSAWSSSPTPTRGGSARTRSTRPCAWAKAWRRSGALQPEPMERALETLELYAHFCAATGIDEIRAVATSAIRDASNQAEFLRAARERSGLEVEVLPGPAEARYGYLAAVNSTTLADGVVLDLGGGSMQLTRVADRARRRRALVAAGCGAHDRALPARRKQEASTKALREHVAAELDERRVARRGRAAGRGRRHGAQPRRGGAARGRAALLRHPGLSGDARGARRADRGVLRAWPGRARRRARASRPRAAT